jgi:hypothetical protein
MTSREFDNKELNSGDYLYNKIHKQISQKIQKDINMNDDEISKLIDEELAKI